MSDHHGCCILHHVIGPSEARKAADAERAAKGMRERIEALVVRWVEDGSLPVAGPEASAPTSARGSGSSTRRANP